MIEGHFLYDRRAVTSNALTMYNVLTMKRLHTQRSANQRDLNLYQRKSTSISICRAYLFVVKKIYKILRHKFNLSMKFLFNFVFYKRKWYRAVTWKNYYGSNHMKILKISIASDIKRVKNHKKWLLKYIFLAGFVQYIHYCFRSYWVWRFPHHCTMWEARRKLRKIKTDGIINMAVKRITATFIIRSVNRT